MKYSFLCIMIFLVVLPAFFTNYEIVKRTESSNQSTPYFQVEYTGTNGSVTNFDIQNINLHAQVNLYVSVVENNLVYYNNFSFNQLQALPVLSLNNFKNSGISTNYLNDSTLIQASQYYEYGSYNVFIVYYQIKNINFASIFVIDPSSNTIVSTKLLSNFIYYKTNKIVQFATSNDLWIEMRNSSSFFIWNISNTNYLISKEYQSANVNLNQSYFSINDVQFYNDQLYVLFNEQSFSQSSYTSRIHIFSIYNAQNGSSFLQSNSMSASDYYSSITIQNNNLYALSELNSSVTEYDLTSFQQTDQIGIGTSYNHSLIRSFSNNDFIIGSGNSVFQQYSVQNNLFNFKNDLFNLFNPQSANEFYTLELLNNNNVQSYFLAGYVKSNNVNTGFAMMFEDIQTKPKLLIDPNNQGLTIKSTLGTTTITSNSLDFNLIIAVVIVIVIIFGGIFYFLNRKDKGIPKEKIVNQTNENTGHSLQDVIKLCPMCGSKIYKSDVFCQNCGEKILE